MKTMDISKLRRLAWARASWETKSWPFCQKKRLTRKEAYESIEFLADLSYSYRKAGKRPDVAKYLESLMKSLLECYHRTWKDNPDYRR